VCEIELVVMIVLTFTIIGVAIALSVAGDRSVVQKVKEVGLGDGSEGVVV